MKLKKRQYTLIVASILTVTAVLVTCSLLSTLISPMIDPTASNGPGTAAKAVVAPTGPEIDRAEPAWLGIIGATIQPEMAQAMRLPADQTGVLVQFVESQSPAKAAGVQGCEDYVTVGDHRWLVGGDVITALDGRPVNNMQELRALLGQAGPDQQVSLTMLRGEETLTVTATLAEFPELDLSSSSSRLRVT